MRTKMWVRASVTAIAWVGGVAALTLGVAVGTSTATELTSPVPVVRQVTGATDYDPALPPVVTGCVIRFYDTGPEIHANSAHVCTGANSVEMDERGDLLVRSDWHGAVISIDVDPDECLTRRHIDGGASNGLGQTRIEFYRGTERLRLDDSRMWGASCNVWITWVHQGPVPVATGG